MYRAIVTVEGTGRGLLMHKFSVAASASLENEVKRSKGAKLSPEQEAEQGAYRMEPTDECPEGQLFLPAEHFLGASTAAGTSFQVRGKGKKTYKDAFKGGLEVYPDYIGLVDGEGKPISKYGIDSRPVRIPATKGRVMRHRAHLKAGWRATFEIEVSDDGIPLEVVQEAVAEAGHSKCVGDYRPRFGQFRIVSFEKKNGQVQ